MATVNTHRFYFIIQPQGLNRTEVLVVGRPESGQFVQGRSEGVWFMVSSPEQRSEGVWFVSSP